MAQTWAKSPLRYPGGKSRAIKHIFPLIPTDFEEYREPFVGGGSVFLSVKSLSMSSMFAHPTRFVIGDIHEEVAAFWRALRDVPDALHRWLTHYHTLYQGHGRELYTFFSQHTFESDLDRAVRFFILNRITFSGVMEAGGYSQQAFEGRFTRTSLDRLQETAAMMMNVEIVCGDYEPLVMREGENVFLFLDPPYAANAASKLYGARGILHTGFDHERFAEVMRQCPHRWLLTYDDTPVIRTLFDFAHIRSWQLQYGMNNFKQGKADKGDEIFISNY